MAEKIVRGQVITFSATPKDSDGNLVTPGTIRLYVNYIHADGTRSTDDPTDMDPDTEGSYSATFDTAQAKAGTASASVRTTSPGAAADFKFTITAEPANPNP